MTKVAGQRQLKWVLVSKEEGERERNSGKKKTRAKEVGIEEGRGEERMDVWVNLRNGRRKASR